MKIHKNTKTKTVLCHFIFDNVITKMREPLTLLLNRLSPFGLPATKKVLIPSWWRSLVEEGRWHMFVNFLGAQSRSKDIQSGEKVETRGSWLLVVLIGISQAVGRCSRKEEEYFIELFFPK